MGLRQIALINVLSILVVVPIFAGTTSDWEEYADKQLHVAFRHPKEWRPSPLFADRTYFGGPDGSLQLDASEGDSPDQVCQGAASHHLQPFGSHPQIRPMNVQGRKACLVWPSEDEGAPYYAELVVEFQRPIEIDGHRYSQLTLHADKKHILEIMKTLRFISH
jgi:TolB protein